MPQSWSIPDICNGRKEAGVLEVQFEVPHDLGCTEVLELLLP